MPKYPSYIATLPAITNRTQINTTFAREWQEELLALQKDYVSTIGSYTYLASYLSVAHRADGKPKEFVVSHAGLASVSADQHHARLHATSHVNGVDPIPNVSDTRNGLLQYGTFLRLNFAQPYSNYIPYAYGYYIGNGVDGRYIYLGFTPRRFIRVALGSGIIGSFTFYSFGSPDSALWRIGIQERHSYHKGVDSDNQVVLTDNGFIVYADANINPLYYYFFVI